MTTDPIAAAIDHIRSITPQNDPWTAGDVSSFSPWEPDESDYAIATILNAVVSGRLILTDALEAERAKRQRAEKAVAERAHWMRAARHAGVCMTCSGPNGAPDPFGCTDCLNTGWSSEYHNGMADAQMRADSLQEELEHERAKVAAAYEAAADACNDYPVAAPSVYEWTRYDLQIEYSQASIRALTPADAQAALDKMLAEARLEGWRAGREAAAKYLMRDTAAEIRALPERKETSHD